MNAQPLNNKWTAFSDERVKCKRVLTHSMMRGYILGNVLMAFTPSELK